MKDPLERTKVVVRRLPPAISRSAFMEQIDGKFAGKYKWICFRPGKNTCGYRSYLFIFCFFALFIR